MSDDLLDKAESRLSGDDKTPQPQRADEIEPSGFLHTGNLAVNWAISGRVNGGYPIGKITAFAGDSFTGKSVMVQRAVAMAQRSGGRALVNDSENAYSPHRMEGLGIDLQKLSLISTDTVEEHHNAVVEFLDVVKKHGGDETVVLALDSLGDLTTTQEQEHGLGKRTVGEKARQIKKHLRIVGNRMSETNLVYLIVQHVYRNIGQNFGDPRQASGGEGPKFRSSVQIMLNSADEGDDGVVIRGKTIKTRLCRPFRKFEFFVPWDREPAEYGGVIPMGLEKGILRENGHSVDVVHPETGEVVAEKVVKTQKSNPAKRVDEENKLVEEYPEIIEWLEDEDE